MRIKHAIIIGLIGILCGCSERRDQKPTLKTSSESRTSTNTAAGPATLPSDPAPSVEGIARTYKSFRTMTPGAVPVSAALIAACAPAIPTETKFDRDSRIAHGAKVTIFMNESAAAAFRDSGSAYPLGSVIVKQKESLGVGGMVKRAPGFDAAHGDWEYFYFEDPAKITSGRISTCVDCHAGAKGTDHVFGSWAVYRQ